MVSPPFVKPRTVSPSLLAGLVLIIGLITSGAAAKHTHSLIQKEAQFRFNSLKTIILDDLERRFTQPRYGLMGAHGSYAAHNNLTRDQLGAYVAARDLGNEFPGIMGIGMIKPVARADLDAFIAAERTDNYPDFQLKTVGNDPMCYVITSVFPNEQNKAAWGLDVGSEPVRRAGVEQAIASGQPTLTGVITLLITHISPFLFQAL
jgi:CHASE1-domain containing sensor protein